MRALILCFLLLVSTACSDEALVEPHLCHLMACTSSISIDGPSLEAWAADEMESLRVCVEDRCQTVTRTQIDAGFALRNPGTQVTSFRIYEGNYRFEHIGWGIEGNDLDVTIEATIDDVVQRTSARVPFAAHQPNGPGCPPTCVTSDVVIKENGTIEPVAS